MALVEVNWTPNNRQLRLFGLAALAACAILAGYLAMHKGMALPWCLLVVLPGAATAISSLVLPRLALVVYRVLICLTLPIGLSLSLILMSLFFFGLITPIAILFRLVGRDSLNRRFDPGAQTYWIQHTTETDQARYFQQF